MESIHILDSGILSKLWQVQGTHFPHWPVTELEKENWGALSVGQTNRVWTDQAVSPVLTSRCGSSPGGRAALPLLVLCRGVAGPWQVPMAGGVRPPTSSAPVEGRRCQRL